MSQQNGPIRGRKTAFTWPFSLASLNKERQGNPASKTDWEPDFPAVIEWLTVGPYVKNPPKIRLKKSWNYYACDSLTYFIYVAHTITRNRNDVNQMKFAWNNSWNCISWIYFRRFLAIGDHCVAEVGRFWRYLAKWRRRQLAFLLNILLLFGFGQQRTMAAWK